MTGHSDEHQRTMAFAEIALAQIRALRQPASPRHYEVWYIYATGHNPSLNQTINETLARNGTLAVSDIEQIYESYISPNRITERIDRVGSKVKGEIEQVMAMIGAAAGSASSYTENLASASEKLSVALDEFGVRTIVESLVQATKEMQQNNQMLEASLNASKQEIMQLHEILEVVRNESLTDPLTSLANRKSFDDTLPKLMEQARERGQPLALMLTDIDHFKRFNDSYGHVTGDQVLRLVGLAVKQNVRSQDLAARYGGEEFVVVLPNMTLLTAIAVADQIRRAVMVKELIKRSTGEFLGRITISLGLTTLRADDTPATLIERADGCLYAAKRAGRNRVVSVGDAEDVRPGAKVA